MLLTYPLLIKNEPQLQAAQHKPLKSCSSLLCETCKTQLSHGVCMLASPSREISENMLPKYNVDTFFFLSSSFPSFTAYKGAWSENILIP